MEDDGDDFSFDFESTLEEQQKQAASGAPSGDPSNIASAAVPVNQSSSSFKRNFRQTVCTYWLKGVCALGDSCGFLHEYNAERMPVCKTLIKFGVCKEPDCPYKHALDDIKECNMFKLGFCVYGPQCRYRHTKLGGPPPDPKDVDAAKPREFRAGGRDSTGNEAGRGRGRSSFGRGEYLRGEGGWGGRGPPRPPPPRPPGPRPPPLDEGAPPPRPGFGQPPMMGSIGFVHPGMGMGMGMSMPGMGMMMPGMQMGMGHPFWGMGMGGMNPMGGMGGHPFPPFQ